MTNDHDRYMVFGRNKAIYTMVLCLKMSSNVEFVDSVELSRPGLQLQTLGNGILVKLKCMKLS